MPPYLKFSFTGTKPFCATFDNILNRAPCFTLDSALPHYAPPPAFGNQGFTSLNIYFLIAANLLFPELFTS